MPIVEPEPIVAQSRSPITIDLDSPQEPDPPIPKPVHKPAQPNKAVARPPRAAVEPVAPFPDMGMPIPVAAVVTPAIKGESPAHQVAPVASMSSSVPPDLKPSLPQQPAPPNPQDSSMTDLLTLQRTDSAVSIASNPELNFTDMQFSLAPTNDSQNQGQSQQSDFDLATFAPSDGGILLLDSLLPPSSDIQQAELPLNQTPPEGSSSEAADGKAVKPEPSNVDDMYDLDAGPAVDDMNLDFDLGVGGDAEESNFENLFFDNQMEHGEFDEQFFGLT
jgi:hypothetical protein